MILINEFIGLRYLINETFLFKFLGQSSEFGLKISSNANITCLSLIKEYVQAQAAWWSRSLPLSLDLLLLFFLFFLCVVVFLNNLCSKHSGWFGFGRFRSLDFHRPESLWFFALDVLFFHLVNFSIIFFIWTASLMRFEVGIYLVEFVFAKRTL